jgi:DNA-binding NarL/FixJ family response regulator
LDGIEGSTPDLTMPRPRVLLIDEKALIREALRVGLEECGLTVVGCCEPGAEATARLRRDRPDVLVVGDGADGVGLIYARELKASSDARIVLFTSSVRPDARYFEGLGFEAVVGKHLGLVEFAQVIHAVATGLAPRARPAAPVPSSRTNDRGVQLMASMLTRREREVLELLAAGATSEQLADELSLSPHTVRTHIQNIMSKLQVHSRLEAATLAVHHGIVAASSGGRLAG